jgi:hypothetical protein
LFPLHQFQEPLQALRGYIPTVAARVIVYVSGLHIGLLTVVLEPVDTQVVFHDHPPFVFWGIEYYSPSFVAVVREFP